MTENEGLIIRQCLDGNREAFEVLVNRYESHVKALAWNIVGNPEEALEISQETFLQAYKNLHRFDLSRNFKHWLLGITIKRSIDKLRKQKTFLSFFNRYTSVAATTVEEIRPIEESPVFHPLLNRLKERERIALSLQINESYTAAEIGEVLNCSENSVRVLLFKAKQKLRNALSANNTKLKKQKNNKNEVSP